MIRVAINGFGRIGRTTLKTILSRKLKGLKVVAVNDLTDTATLAHLFKYDSNYRAFSGFVSHAANSLKINGQKILVTSLKDPAQLPWQKLKIDVVIESTGLFRTEEAAAKHLEAGAKAVIISAPGKGGDVPTYVRGVNDYKYKGQHKIINNASCTTNCIAPVAAIMQSKFGVKKAIMTTVHGYTADQKLQDAPHKDLRRARQAATNMIPTTTGAAIATTETIPELKGLFNGLSIRVPIPVVSLADFTFLLKKKTTVEEINKAFEQAKKNPLYKNVLDTTTVPLVSSDFIGNSFSSIIDLPLTKVVAGDLVKVVAWYDNEWAYSCRLAEMAVQVGKRI